MGPYKMVFVNVLLFVLLLIGFFAFKFIFKKKINPLFLVVLFSLLPTVSIFRTGVYQSGDFAINIEKTIELYNSLSYGIFPVHWASILNATYGYPLFIFTYPLPYYFISFFHFVGFSFIFSEKLVLFLAFLISGIAMYLFIKIFLKPFSAFTGAILYLFAPYHLVDLHFRTDIGEVFALTFLPLILLFIAKFVKKPTILNFSLISFFYCCLILSHQAVAIATTPFLFIIPLFLRTKTRLILYLAFFVGILLSSFYWIPILDLIKYTNQPFYSHVITFENPLLFLFSPWRYGMLYQGPYGQLSFPMGFVQILLIFVAIFYLLRQKVKKRFLKTLKILVLGLFLLIFMLLPISKPLWQTLPFINNFQFSYRLMAIIILFTSLIGAIVIENIKNKKFIYLIIFFAVFPTILNWGNRAMIPTINDNYLISHAPFSTFEGEGLNPASPKWTNPKNPWMKNPPVKHLEVISGNSNILETKRTPVLHKYLVRNATKTNFKENTLYFPGWNVFVDGKNTAIQYVGKNKGIIHFEVPKGVHLITVKYMQTPVFIITEIISSLAFAILVFLNFYAIFHKRR